MNFLNVLPLHKPARQFPTSEIEIQSKAIKKLAKKVRKLNKIKEKLNIESKNNKLISFINNEINIINKHKDNYYYQNGFLDNRFSKKLVFNNNLSFSTIADIQTRISASPITLGKDLLSLADSFDMCLFHNNVFNEDFIPNEYKSEIKEFENEMSTIGFDIYIVAPLNAYDFQKEIKLSSKVNSYWGKHSYVNNTLRLTINVFRDLYNKISTLEKNVKDLNDFRKENEEHLSHLHEELNRVIHELEIERKKRIDREHIENIEHYEERIKNYWYNVCHVNEHNAKPKSYNYTDYINVYSSYWGTDMPQPITRTGYRETLPMPIEPLRPEKENGHIKRCQYLQKNIDNKTVDLLIKQSIEVKNTFNNFMIVAAPRGTDINNLKGSEEFLIGSLWGAGFTPLLIESLGVKEVTDENLLIIEELKKTYY
jgi:hypothetical protein